MTPDPWAEWLFTNRHGIESIDHMHDALIPIRDRVVDGAAITPGDTLLDVGTGDGLIGLEAAHYVGPHGRVIFSDICLDCLDYCADMAAGLPPAVETVHTGLPDLAAIDDESADVVTLRSVLVYVADRAGALRNIYRVLKPGGRLSLYEPLPQAEPPGRFEGYNAAPVAALAERVKQQLAPTPAMLAFSAERLIEAARAAGFRTVNLQQAIRIDEQHAAPDVRGDPWEVFLSVAPHPLTPTIGEAIGAALTPVEAEAFTTHLRPLVRTGQRLIRQQSLYLQANR
ncbi:MAG: methyltransferase domain-containing protein [Chloroflexi bacterium]|nr:methyltransferase domain-containing protein [Chloroflexota bacterium]